MREGAFYNLSALRLKNAALTPGLFAYRVERWKMKGLRERELLTYAVAPVQTPVPLVPDPAEAFVFEVLTNAVDWDNPAVQSESVLAALQILDADLGDRFARALNQFEAENTNQVNVHEAKITNHFQRRIAADQRAIATMEARGRNPTLIKARRKAIENYEQKLRDKLAALKAKSRVEDEITEVAAGIVAVEP